MTYPAGGTFTSSIVGGSGTISGFIMSSLP